jgi:hypothetical protein
MTVDAGHSNGTEGLAMTTYCGRAAVLAIVGLCLLVPLLPAGAAVEIPAGTASSDQAALKDIVAAFERAEAAVQKSDVDALMPFYATAYNYHGLKRSDVRRVWEEVFAHYRGLSSQHVFTKFEVVTTNGTRKAYVTCTGALYGTDKDSGRPVTLDTWVNEIHFLIKEEGTWRFHGNAGGDTRSVPAGSAPHHPLF